MKNKFQNIKNYFKQKFSNFSNSIKIFISKHNLKDNFKLMFFYATIPGALINYSLWGIFGIPFKWYTFSAYGIFLYLIKVEVLTIWTHLWFKNPQ